MLLIHCKQRSCTIEETRDFILVDFINTGVKKCWTTTDPVFVQHLVTLEIKDHQQIMWVYFVTVHLLGNLLGLNVISCSLVEAVKQETNQPTNQLDRVQSN